MTSKEISENEFDRLLIEAVDETLSTFGEPVKNALYLNLKLNFDIEREKIPFKVDKFSDIIHKIFGLGANRLEFLLIKKLKAKLGANTKLFKYEDPSSDWVMTDMSLKEYISEMREKFEATSKYNPEMGILGNDAISEEEFEVLEI